MDAGSGGRNGTSRSGAPSVVRAPDTVHPTPQSPIDKTIGVWRPPAGLEQALLWPGIAPHSEGVRFPPEHSETGTNPKRFAGLPVTGIYDVLVPTMTVFPAKVRSTWAALLVFGLRVTGYPIDVWPTLLKCWLKGLGPT